MNKKTVLIIGAGPAGLTAAYELIKTGDFIPIIIEKLDIPGGLSRTVNYKGNRIDIGGHRFFSKSDRVMNWWLDVLPVEQHGHTDFNITYQGKTRPGPASTVAVDARNDDGVMLVRQRTSRIYFLRRLFEYPIRLSV